MTTIEREQQIKKIFNRVYNGEKNYFTPYIVEVGETKEYLYEISKGRPDDEWFRNKYGVTFLRKANHDKCTDKNKLFDSYQKAKDYVGD